MRKLAHWLEEYTEGESIDLLTDLATRLLDDRLEEVRFCHPIRPLKGVFGVGWTNHRVMTFGRLRDLLRNRKYREFCEFEPRYDDMSFKTRDWAVVRQAQALFQKAEFLDVGIDRQAAARKKFEEAEALCGETNRLFKLWRTGNIAFPSVVEACFHRASRIISDVLGEVPSVSQLPLRFGPGASTQVKKRDASRRRKLSADVSCSEELLPWAARLLEELPHISELLWTSKSVEYHVPTGIKLDERWTVPVKIEPGVVSFVPKNYKTDRPTETQPTLNGMFQLGIGDVMKDRLASKGLDLSDQSLNQRLAREGSLTGALATLDLSSASDTIATELVAHLLPVDWFSLLNAARVGKTRVPWGSDPVVLQKFSAMGNGFTFPLESLIFWALTRAVVEHKGLKSPQVNVYGDDIICPVEAVADLKLVLTAAGFLVNNEKSCCDGPFRESCGADFLRGIDIRPVYVKKLLTPAGLFALHNGLKRRGEDAAVEYVRKALHPCLQIEGPDGYGDGHLISENWLGRPYLRHLGYEGTIFDTFARVPKRDRKGLMPGDRIFPHYVIYRRGSSPVCAPVEGLRTSNFSPLRRVGFDVPVFLEVSEPSLPIGLGKDDMGGVINDDTLPGDEGYKKISIYTLGKRG